MRGPHEFRKAWAKMARIGPSHDDHLFYRYARLKGYKVTREPYQGVNVGVKATETRDRIAYAMQRGMKSRFKAEARYLMPEDRKRCFDYVLKAIFQESSHGNST